MNASPSLHRRSLLAAAILGAMSLCRSPLGAVSGSQSADERVRKRLVSLLHEPERASMAGAVYLRSPLGRQSPPSMLVKSVLDQIGPDVGNEAMRLHIARRIRRELGGAEVVSLDGWIVSPTEAWLCGLAAAG